MPRPVINKQLADALAQLGNGSYSNEGNALQHTLYDTAQIPAALGTNVNYFTQPIGAAYANGNKTITETNLNDPGKLPNGQGFIATAMSVAVKFNADTVAGGANSLFEDAVSGFYGFLQNSVFEIRIAGREYDYQVPGTEFLPTAPLAVQGGSTTTLAAQRLGDYWTSGWTKLNQTPIVIGNLVSFSVVQISGQQDTAAEHR